MKSWEDELAEILAKKGVQPEQPAEPEPTITIFRYPHKHPGITYRLDLIAEIPQMRIILPIDDGPYKINLYHVQLAPTTPLRQLFSFHMTFLRSHAFQEERGILEYSLLLAYADLMQALFWQGDLNRMQFPQEIHVLRLL
jgi:hypothetical protein